MTATALDNIALAAAAADRVPGGFGTQLLDAARVAFTSGLRVVAIIGAVLFVALGVYAAISLRHVPQTGTGSEGGGAKGDPALVAR